jgi:hypothetical protein
MISSSPGSLSAHCNHQTFVASTTEDSSTDSSQIDRQGPILQAYPLCENNNPQKKKKRQKEAWTKPKVMLRLTWWALEKTCSESMAPLVKVAWHGSHRIDAFRLRCSGFDFMNLFQS